ncbi:long-chain-fatty-acid--CoA ligase [Magnetospirillum aberrantis]|uniref:3-methylmercaptopropionyl-CoA ligase n=1 Tax=Magnetospirillum aberrantis SpK TaxID=908842 RepID=A0A7C9USZ6_9PROT|nr:long-chain-fatty-acid--CoA ligase [Magnetospirillum aberrantis]NFV79648.1 long-chain-fatty-acid--CoA ligase [Magnetospirillum aberrantis SpK]
MRGQMMQLPLDIGSILRFAAKFHGDTEIVSRTVEGPVHRTTYAEAALRVARLGNALRRLGVKRGDVVGTIAWNGYRHFELYYAIAGLGAVCHTTNPRLFADQISFILDDAGDEVLFFDLTFLPLVETLAGRLPKVRAFVLMTDRAHMPANSPIPNLLCYEELVEAESDDIDWPRIDEHEASGLCYTSGTTGNPRGVLYSHRSSVLHAMASNLADGFALSARDAVLPVVPMFHVNAWGIPYSAAMVGAKLVFPGPHLDGTSLRLLIADEDVTITAGVPTVWMNLLAHCRDTGTDLAGLERVVVGGAACSASLMEGFEALGVRVIHAWGMTETSPLGLANTPSRKSAALPAEAQRKIALKQGRPIFGVDLKVADSHGNPLPQDGHSPGALKISGHWICDGYFRLDPVDAHAEPGWFDTGDVATMTDDGFVEIVDRTKDMIKSGGEWISSIQLENVMMSHPMVREAAAIARPDDRWGERPRLVVALRDGAQATPAELREFFEGRVSKWCVPDDVLIVDELPHTATGKLLKTALRALYAQVPVDA